MNINLQFENHALILFLEGPFNQPACLEVQKLLDHAKVHFYSHVVFDLGHVPCVERCGLELMFGIAHSLKERGGRISVVTPQSHLRVLLQQMDHGQLVSIYRSKKEALRAA